MAALKYVVDYGEHRQKSLTEVQEKLLRNIDRHFHKVERNCEERQNLIDTAILEHQYRLTKEEDAMITQAGKTQGLACQLTTEAGKELDKLTRGTELFAKHLEKESQDNAESVKKVLEASGAAEQKLNLFNDQARMVMVAANWELAHFQSDAMEATQALIRTHVATNQELLRQRSEFGLKQIQVTKAITKTIEAMTDMVKRQRLEASLKQNLEKEQASRNTRVKCPENQAPPSPSSSPSPSLHPSVNPIPENRTLKPEKRRRSPPKVEKKSRPRRVIKLSFDAIMDRFEGDGSQDFTAYYHHFKQTLEGIGEVSDGDILYQLMLYMKGTAQDAMEQLKITEFNSESLARAVKSMAATFDKELLFTDAHVRLCRQHRRPVLEDIRKYFIRLRKEVDRCAPALYPTEACREKAVLSQACLGCDKRYINLDFTKATTVFQAITAYEEEKALRELQDRDTDAETGRSTERPRYEPPRERTPTRVRFREDYGRKFDDRYVNMVRQGEMGYDEWERRDGMGMEREEYFGNMPDQDSQWHDPERWCTVHEQVGHSANDCAGTSHVASQYPPYSPFPPDFPQEMDPGMNCWNDPYSDRHHEEWRTYDPPIPVVQHRVPFHNNFPPRERATADRGERSRYHQPRTTFQSFPECPQNRYDATRSSAQRPPNPNLPSRTMNQSAHVPRRHAKRVLGPLAQAVVDRSKSMRGPEVGSGQVGMVSADKPAKQSARDPPDRKKADPPGERKKVDKKPSGSK